MRMKALTCLAAAVGVVGGASLALAQHNEPFHATKFSSSLVTSYAACTAPTGNSTKTLPLPACNAVRSDPTCDFAATGSSSGTVSANVHGQRIRMHASASNLDPGCNGKTLCLVASLRATTDDCLTPPCTVQESTIQDYPTGCCCVAFGVCETPFCRFTPTLPFASGKRAGLQLEGCALENGSAHTFDCGILYP
jgi:hypothetical protein